MIFCGKVSADLSTLHNITENTLITIDGTDVISFGKLESFNSINNGINFLQRHYQTENLVYAVTAPGMVIGNRSARIRKSRRKTMPSHNPMC